MNPSLYILSYEMKASTAGRSFFLSTSFFLIVVLTANISMNQFGIRAEKNSISILWIALALSALLSVNMIFQNDYDDGTLDWFMLSPISLETIVILKAVAHWVTTCLPMMLLTPIVCISMGINFNSSLWILLVMMIGTCLLYTSPSPRD